MKIIFSFLVFSLLFYMSLMAEEKNIVFLAGGPSHGPGNHEYRAGSMLLAKALNESGLGFKAKVYQNWVDDISQLDEADAVVVFANAGGRFNQERLASLDKKVKSGMGIMFIHYGVHPSKSVGQKYFTPWIGGYFETGYSVNPFWTAEMSIKEGHPVGRGIDKPFTVNDEFYFNMRFPKGDAAKDCYSIADSVIKPEHVTRYNNLWNKSGDDGFGKRQSLMWCRDPQEGGRGVGFTGGHYHHNWAVEGYRKMVLNAIAWISQVEVPHEGVPSKDITSEELNSNIDGKLSKKLVAPDVAKIKALPAMLRPLEPKFYNQQKHYALVKRKAEEKKKSFPLVATKNFDLPDDLEITVWAKSPDLYNPTNMDMDAHGRMWVTEGINYRRHKSRAPKGDRVMVLQDTNYDGKVDQSHVFVQDPKLIAPLGIAVFGNRIVVSQPPELIVYTDVDHNLVFNPKVDKREVLLTGFNGSNHDHSLHAVTAGPSGKWYINQGNCGAEVKDRSNKTFRIGSSYKGGATLAGQKSDDGFVWVGGFVGRMNPDGTNLEIVGHNMRNSYEHTVNSFGDIFQSDNDDPPACRNGYVLEYGSAGFFSADGKISWETARRPGQSIPVAHWRQEDPGFMPPGDVYGSGAPTGVAFYENGALGEAYRGMYLAADAGQRVIFNYFPKAEGAGFKMERHNLLKSKNTGNGYNFRPSDIEVGADGALYVCDWYDQRVGGHADKDDTLSGTIYRIAPKSWSVPKLKPKTESISDLIELLKSPADNVRFLAIEGLKKKGPDAIAALKELMKHSNPWIAVRPIWILPHLGEEGKKACLELLNSKNSKTRLVAYKALRRSDINILPYAKKLCSDGDAAVRREVATSLRNFSFNEKVEIISTIYELWDGIDKTYLEAIGLSMTNFENKFWNSLNNKRGSGNWTTKFSKITWRLYPVDALPELIKRSSDSLLTEVERKLAIDTIAFVEGPKAPQAMLEVYKASGPQKDYAQMWFTLNLDGNRWDGLIDRDMVAEQAGVTKPGLPVPYEHPAPPKEREVAKLDDILKLKGNEKQGEVVAMRCVMCHVVGDKGTVFGPSLNGWGKSRSHEQILTAILNPDTDIAHGYDASRVHLKDGRVIDGLVKSGKERAWHFVNIRGGDSYLVMKTAGGVEQKISWRLIKEVKSTKKSMMLYPENLGLTKAQDLSDLASYLKNL